MRQANEARSPGPGALYVVGTPIGNLEDITLRAIRILNESDMILAEDTRVTRILLDRHGIRKPMVSLHAHNEAARIDEVLDWLDAGRKLALVTDAGTPALSDPGAALVRAVRDAGHAVHPIPGPSAITAALSIAGLPVPPATFLGFFPRKRVDRRRILDHLNTRGGTYVFFEAPHRIAKTLRALVAEAPRLHVVLAREMTKIHESLYEGTPAEIQAGLQPDEIRGEMVLILHAAASMASPPEQSPANATTRPRFVTRSDRWR
ncbi:MAG: 16S rRNA (cytidine(1402)-2'-O)-methyltransferase [Nitrospirae bacterium]|nr:16S rRNA (cytidine(1402)-2'-O)-methyltransferase [Nitrospirota bacterium]